jgi:hypothetical protein
MIKLNRRELLLGASLVATSVRKAAARAADRYTLMMFYDPLPGREAEFDAWWPGHLAAVAAIPGFSAAEGYLRKTGVIGTTGNLPLPARLALYSIVTDNLDGVFRELNKRISQGTIAYSPAVNQKSMVTLNYKLALQRKATAKTDRGDNFIRIVAADMTPGREQEFRKWYDEIHSVEKMKMVIGIQEITRSDRIDSCPSGKCDSSPQSLSLWRYGAKSHSEFLAEIAKVNPLFAKSSSYVSETAWRTDYQKMF